jgi:hypothetical protein
LVGDLDQNASAVARKRVRAYGTSVREVLENQ